ncbi:MAG: hypothetical protein WCR74_01455 [Betaproteobacteria bacterium]
MKTRNEMVNWGIGIVLLFPLFFQLSSGIYKGLLVDSGGNIATLPIPIAVFACFGGIALLSANFRQTYAAMAFIASMLFVMLLSVAFAGSEYQLELRKLIVLAQFLIPTFALVLGQMVNDNDKTIPKAFLTVLLLVVPAQLVAGWLQGTLTLTHNLYVFSIYQHFQFVPLIFVCAFIYAMVALWETHKVLLLILLPFMFIYATASVSFLTIAAFLIFVAAFTYRKLVVDKNIPRGFIPVIIVVLVALTAAGTGTYLSIAQTKTSITGDDGQYIGKFKTLSEGKLPLNLSDRFSDWRLFGKGIVESPRTFVFGHVTPMARAVRTSAHNWYIDITYSFGLLSLLPVCLLIVFTMHLFWRTRINLTPEIQCLALVVLYLVVIDSNFKVTLRQPYSGIFTFFLWGLLLSRLRGAATRRLGA